MVNQKTTAVRLIPVIGKRCGEILLEFGGLLRLCTDHAGKSVFLRELCDPQADVSRLQSTASKINCIYYPHSITDCGDF